MEYDIQAILKRCDETIAERGITRKQVTRELNISVSSFYDWGKGKAKPSLETMMRIAKRLNITMEYLCYGIDNRDIIPDPVADKVRKLSDENKLRVSSYIDGLLASSGDTNEYKC